MHAREALIEALSDLDEGIVNVFMDCDGDHSKVPASAIQKSLCKLTQQGTCVPILCGASFKNMGVQPLLDAVVDYLPSPDRLPPPQANDEKGNNVPILMTDKDLCALAFKVTFDAQRGPLVFVRVYAGRLDARSVLQISNTALHSSLSSSSHSHAAKRKGGLHGGGSGEKERATKLLEMYADDYEEIGSIEAGNIGVVVGFKQVKTGDTLLSFSDSRRLALHNISIPPTVFIRSISVERSSEEKALAVGLENLIREDPSLVLSVNEETGQTLLAGMGELHLEIAGERLLEVYKVNCKLGKVEISYRETLAATFASDGSSISQDFSYEKELLGKELRCEISMEMQRIDDDVVDIDSSITPEQIHQGDHDELLQEVSLDVYHFVL